jgi:hypothetical protein
MIFMFRRPFAFLLALVLLWSGASACEPLGSFLAADLAEQPLIAGSAEPGDRSEGTVADHHLDDLPSQSPGDLMQDLPGLPPSALTIRGRAAAVACPLPLEPARLPAPCLAAPERPPRPAPVHAGA